jgi:hypothetical protein
MKLINPIYDASFKYMMQDTRVARFFLTVLLDKEVEIESLEPQETIIRHEDEEKVFLMPRMDFIAIINEKDGTRKKVLIELQQSFYINDIERFRRYLGKNYLKQDLINKRKENLEIISIYILGFKVGLPVAAVSTSKQLINIISDEKEIINKTVDNIEFIKKLHHQVIVVDTTQLTEKVRTRVEKLLAVFSPKFRDESKKTITIPHNIAQEINSLVTEKEQENIILKKLEEANEDVDVIYAIEEQEIFTENLKNIKEDAKQEGEKLKAIEMAKKMKIKKFDIEEIAELTGLSIEEINQLI